MPNLHYMQHKGVLYLNFATQFIKVSFHTQSLFSLFWPSKSGLGPSVGFHCSSCVFEVSLRFNLSQDPAFDQYSTLSGLYMGYLEQLNSCHFSFLSNEQDRSEVQTDKIKMSLTIIFISPGHRSLSQKTKALYFGVDC